MVTLRLVRIDNRLIHGQVMTLWSKEYAVDHILAIDDTLAKDPFMQRIYGMAIPKPMKWAMLSVEEAAQCWKDNKLDSGNYLVLMRDVETALRAWKAGFGIEKLQIGTLNASPTSEILHAGTRLSREHIPSLVEMQKGGVEVYIHPIPAVRPISLGEILQNS